MRREGYIIEEIIEYSNMSEAFDSVLRGTDRKRSRQGRFLLAHREKIIAELTASIADGSFRLGGYHEREIEEYGKKRILQILSMKDRIAVFAIMNVVDRHLQKRYIRTTGASIKRRGTHDLMNCIRTDLQKDPEGTLYAYKFDIRRFYDNARQDFVIWCFRRVFKDKRLLVLLERFVKLLPEGISFGLRSSQGAGNLLLSVFLDHYLYQLKFRSKEMKYLPTKSVVKEKNYSFNLKYMESLKEMIESGNFSNSFNIKKEKGGNLRLDVLMSADKKFAAVRLLQFIPYSYIPVIDMQYLRNDKIIALENFLEHYK